MTNKIKLTVFWLARAVGLFALSRAITDKKIRILCYHGGCLGDESRYNPKLFCSATMLAQRMHWLQAKGFDIVPLSVAASRMRQSPHQRTALTTAITFDDGWYSTASELVPVLGKLSIASTLYLCTSHYREGWAVPTVSVRYLIWKCGLQTAQLRGFGAELDGELDLSTPRMRDAAAESIVAAIERAPAERTHRHALLEKLASCLQVPSDVLALDSRRFDYVSQEELLAVARQGCSVELHGDVHHYPAGNIAMFTADMQKCSDIIVEAGLPRPTHYCYPSGNFDGAASDALSAMGVQTATTCLPGLITQANASESHYLPRFLDGESISMLEFEAELSGFSDIVRRMLRKPHPLQPS